MQQNVLGGSSIDATDDTQWVIWSCSVRCDWRIMIKEPRFVNVRNAFQVGPENSSPSMQSMALRVVSLTMVAAIIFCLNPKNVDKWGLSPLGSGSLTNMATYIVASSI